MAESGDGDTPDAAVEPDAPFHRDTAWSIHQRINACMAEVGFLEKGGTAEVYSKRTGKTFTYDYISHDDVTAAARVPFIKYGIVVLPSVVEHKDDGNRIEVTAQVDFVNIDNPDDKVSVQTIGYGADNSDKGPGKALSYAVKYAYLKILMLNSADDIEQDNILHDPAVTRESAVDAAKDQTRAALETWANNLRDAIRGADSIAAVDELQRVNKDALMSVPETTRSFFVTIIEDRKKQIIEEGGDE